MTKNNGKVLDDDKIFKLWLLEYENSREDYQRAIRSRRRHELILIVFCILVFLYTYPPDKIVNKYKFKIEAISMNITINDVLFFLPPAISILFLLYLVAAIDHSYEDIRRGRLREQFHKICYEKIIITPKRSDVFYFISDLFVPAIVVNIKLLPVRIKTNSKPIFLYRSKILLGILIGFIFLIIPFLLNWYLLIQMDSFLGISISILSLLIMAIPILTMIIGKISFRF